MVAALIPMMDSVACAEGETAKFTVGAKAWFAESSFQWPGLPETEADGVLYGVLASADFERNFWISLMYLQGRLDYDQFESNARDGDLVCGYSFKSLDAGFGFRCVFAENVTLGTSVEMYGPCLYLGTASM